MELKNDLRKQAINAKNAAFKMVSLSNDNRNNILYAIADSLEDKIEDILFRNEIDVLAAKEAGLSSSLVDRLVLTEDRIKEIAKAVRDVADLDDPIGEEISTHTTVEGLLIKKKRVPLGVVGMIYEARPNVTIDTIALCIKSGNAVVLKGGSEALDSNMVLSKIAIEAAMEKGLPAGAIQFIATSDREAIKELLQLDSLIDVIIPRGSKNMIDAIVKVSKVPVIRHGKGLCHTYVDKHANIKMATDIAFNAKVQRPGVCNAMETLLVHEDIAKTFLPLIAKNFKESGVEIRGDEKTRKILSDIKHATQDDWNAEYLDLIISIRVVGSLMAAIEHIRKHGTGHSEAIVTDDKEAAERFLLEVDASSVYHNASTRFTDGGQFGLGAEVGISTQKLHARGPMGIRELTSYKFIIYGQGNIRK
ncbi:MAG: glutamate-5-semialdehyde dehydrogenase [bacterium]|nr:glutamate-5-semialdehyde dehydrogenase [bacterium]